MESLYQPIETHFTPTPEKPEAIDFNYFLQLLQQEENYFKGDQHNTKIMLTRLRKIFYDRYGWNKELIRGAAHIKGRYAVKLVPCNYQNYPVKSSGGVKRKKDYNIERLCRKVTVKPGDWMNPDTGSVPEIYANDNQEVILPDNLYIDLGHVLAGMDAYNYPQPVSPLPGHLMCLYKLFPHVYNNMSCATWLGDIASVAGEFLFEKFKTGKDLSVEEMQKIIDVFASGPDMLGNIDSFVISSIYNTNTNFGMRITQILEDYYHPGGTGSYYRQRRYSAFCTLTGLQNWDGEKFDNEIAWKKHFVKELRTTTAFYIYTRFVKPKSLWLTFMAWIHQYDALIKVHQLIDILLTALKEGIKKEPPK